MKLLNALSLNMYDGDKLFPVSKKITTEEAIHYLCGYHHDTDGYPDEDLGLILESCIGHASTARILSSLLGQEVPVNRCNVQLGHFDTAIVAQYHGPRLPEGATTLPEGATIEFYKVDMEKRADYEEAMEIAFQKREEKFRNTSCGFDRQKEISRVTHESWAHGAGYIIAGPFAGEYVENLCTTCGNRVCNCEAVKEWIFGGRTIWEPVPNEVGIR